jgi:hypothetical protein
MIFQKIPLGVSPRGSFSSNKLIHFLLQNGLLLVPFQKKLFDTVHRFVSWDNHFTWMLSGLFNHLNLPCSDYEKTFV